MIFIESLLTTVRRRTGELGKNSGYLLYCRCWCFLSYLFSVLIQIVLRWRSGRMGERAGATIRQMGTRKRWKSSSPAISAGERGPGEEHDPPQGQEEGKSDAQNVGTRTVLINSFHSPYRTTPMTLAARSATKDLLH